MKKFKFSIQSLLLLTFGIGLVLGVYQWNKPQPIMFQVTALVEVNKGEVVEISAWTYAVPIPKLDPSQAQLYKAVKWSRARFLDVAEADPYTQYHTWYPMELLESDKGEKGLILHTDDYNITKVR